MDVSLKIVKKVFDEDGFLFNPGIIPNQLIDLSSKRDILMLGQIHYAQEHQEFLALLIERLYDSGYRLLINEMPHAACWIIEDYVTNKIDKIPDYILYFHGEYLKQIKQFNKNKDTINKFVVKSCDMNHWNSQFMISIKLMSKTINTHGIFDSILRTNTSSVEYYNEIKKLIDRLDTDKLILEQKLNSHWYKRIHELVYVEEKSFLLRSNNYDPKPREKIIIENCIRYLNGSKAIIDVGSDHAQKQRFCSSDYTHLGEYIKQNYHSASILFLPIKGIVKHNYYGNTQNKFDSTKSNIELDFTRLASEKQGNNLMYLPFNHKVFDEVFTYTDCDKISKMIPKWQADACVIYPAITIAKSMSVNGFIDRQNDL